MEAYCYQYLSNGNYSTKEKRPPLKRGQLKRQIVRTISNLLVPSNDSDRKNVNKRITRCFGSSDDSAYKYSQARSYFPSSSVHLASKHTRARTAREDEEARRSYYRSVMEYCYQYSASSSNNSNMVKEKRPPTKRGHVKVQIARKLSNLVLPRSAGGDAN
ncbi:hypothetical protein PR202_gb01495 [Eleusine coracana subsp. coracana]|uniref:Uncharacterized protein n=1 Tax=Eleusine coracana subsp. coracana TaxID=191504 RepID=A0AAV5DWR7_ELECO|nr:hypothetical protein PR202_gb01495 [Eleusine coracana subsp. coracana]